MSFRLMFHHITERFLPNRDSKRSRLQNEPSPKLQNKSSKGTFVIPIDNSRQSRRERLDFEREELKE